MATCKKVCIMANMGTLGDFKPAVVTAAHLALQGWSVCVVAQPKDKDYTLEKMRTAIGFTPPEETQVQPGLLLNRIPGACESIKADRT
jgi:hypothetical protein